MESVYPTFGNNMSNGSFNTSFTLIINDKIELESNPFFTVEGKVLLSVGWVLSLAIIVENFLTIFVIWTTPALHTIQNKYILSLACADFTVGVAMIELLLLKKFASGCQSTLALLHASITISMFNLITIAVDRYIFIVKPFLHMRKITNRVTNAIILVTWVLGIMYGIGPTYVLDLGNGEDCHPFFMIQHTLITWSYLGHYTISMVATGIFYGLIARTAKQKGEHRKKTRQYVVRTIEDSSDTHRPIKDSRNSSKKKSDGQNFFNFGRKYKFPKRSTSRIGEKKEMTKTTSEISYLWNKYDIPTSVIGPVVIARQNGIEITPFREEFGGVQSSEYNKLKPSGNSRHFQPYKKGKGAQKDTTDHEKNLIKHRELENNKNINTGTNITHIADSINSNDGNSTPTPTNGTTSNINSNKSINTISTNTNTIQTTTTSCNTCGVDTTVTKSSPPKSSPVKLSPSSSPEKISTHETTSSTPITGNDKSTPTPPHLLPSSHSLSHHHSLRWLKQMVMVFGLFVVCWTPSQIAALLYLLGQSDQTPIYILSWLGIANSGVNFYIYAFMNPPFKKALRLKFKGGLCRKCFKSP